MKAELFYVYVCVELYEKQRGCLSPSYYQLMPCHVYPFY